MGVDGHGLYRRPWQSTAGSGTRRVLADLTGSDNGDTNWALFGLRHDFE
jgi:hypothetical protein